MNWVKNISFHLSTLIFFTSLKPFEAYVVSASSLRMLGRPQARMSVLHPVPETNVLLRELIPALKWGWSGVKGGYDSPLFHPTLSDFYSPIRKGSINSATMRKYQSIRMRLWVISWPKGWGGGVGVGVGGDSAYVDVRRGAYLQINGPKINMLHINRII